jgi:DNA-binding LytR/AlgR family response regulator
MLRVAICDDEIDELKRIEGFVRAYDDFDTVAVYNSSKELAWAVEDGLSFDLYLLDVVMPRPDGIELARLIRKTDQTSAIVYLTSHNGHALDAFRVRASQYLIKPVSHETLRRELDAALTALKARNANTFLLKTKEETLNIPFHRIVYCELERRTLCCTTADGKKQTSVTLRKPFEEVVSVLLTDNRFVRPHSSFAVNLDYVESMKSKSLTMKNGTVIPIVHRVAGEIKETYLHYFFRDT